MNLRMISGKNALGFGAVLTVSLGLIAVGCGDSDTNIDNAGGQGGETSSGGSAAGGAPNPGGGGEGGASEPAPSCDAPTAPSETLPFSGIYEDDFGGRHTINATSWTSGDSVFYFSQVDAELSYAIARNSEDNEWNPCSWSRFDWTWGSDEQRYFCQSAFDAPSEQAARDTEAADSENLETGCNGFPWSQLTEISVSVD